MTVVSLGSARKWLTAALAVALPATVLSLPAAAAVKASSGTLDFVPARGVATVPLTAVSTGVCSDPRGTNLQLQVVGRGFPAGTNVTPNLAADLYPLDPSTGGYDVPLQDSLSHFAARERPPAVLSGRYDFTLICKKPWGAGTYETYRGSLWFSSATKYHSLTVAASPTTEASLDPSPAAAPQPAHVSARPHVSLSAATPTSATTSAPTPKVSVAGSTRSAVPVRTTSGAPVQASDSSSAPVPAAASASAGRLTLTPTRPPVASGPTQHHQPIDAGLVAGLLVGLVAVVTASGLVLRRRLTRYGRL